ncbi:MotA/TolQ/ExbB proton channel family protein [Bacteriovoracales bacterium]|nr:MotA/TolQ/ExbB proton channel family protein [Bacteriovoracales bacterium]
MASTEIDLLKIVLESGFVVKGVFLVLILASIFSWSIILKKRKTLSKLRENDEEFQSMFRKSDSLKEIMYKAELMEFSPSREIFIEGYNELNRILEISDNEHFNTFGLKSIERSLQNGMNQANARLENLLSTLASIGSVSPFVGLFGTVWGIINSFTGLAEGGGSLERVAPGIAEALVATAIGLAAAIPAVWFFNHFTKENSNAVSEMENFSRDLLNLIERTISTQGKKY